MDRFDNADTHLVFEGISDGIDNKFGLESIFYGLGFLGYMIVVALFIDLFFTSITSPILYNTFAPIRRRRRAIAHPDERLEDEVALQAEDILRILEELCEQFSDVQWFERTT